MTRVAEGGTGHPRAGRTAARRWQPALAGLVAVALVGCVADRTGDGVPSGDGMAELPATGTDDARELVEERSGLELPGDVEVEVLAVYPETHGVAARFDTAAADTDALCASIGGSAPLAEFSDEQRAWTGVTDDPAFQRICRASDPSSPRRQLEVLHLADQPDPEVVTTYVQAWVMPAR